MPEATVLYSVTAVVVVGLVLWVLFVLKTAKEPWARALPDSAIAAAPGDAGALADGAGASSSAPLIDADSTAKATPVALASEGRPKPPAKDEAKKADEA